ncbi:unnamed protein product [Calicophoron daubneyi]|uniref:Uncharacterized protein n=1 Tax=Calicophoron daubneyi TaxID=300641 RepID=A0AAV2T5I3_CALDB
MAHFFTVGLVLCFVFTVSNALPRDYAEIYQDDPDGVYDIFPYHARARPLVPGTSRTQLRMAYKRWFPIKEYRGGLLEV